MPQTTAHSFSWYTTATSSWVMTCCSIVATTIARTLYLLSFGSISLWSQRSLRVACWSICPGHLLDTLLIAEKACQWSASDTGLHSCLFFLTASESVMMPTNKDWSSIVCCLKSHPLVILTHRCTLAHLHSWCLQSHQEEGNTYHFCSYAAYRSYVSRARLQQCSKHPTFTLASQLWLSL